MEEARVQLMEKRLDFLERSLAILQSTIERQDRLLSRVTESIAAPNVNSVNNVNNVNSVNAAVHVANVEPEPKMEPDSDVPGEEEDEADDPAENERSITWSHEPKPGVWDVFRRRGSSS
jgi:hypothetical protein